jgi:hypothetical protein
MVNAVKFFRFFFEGPVYSRNPRAFGRGGLNAPRLWPVRCWVYNIGLAPAVGDNGVGIGGGELGFQF